MPSSLTPQGTGLPGTLMGTSSFYQSSVWGPGLPPVLYHPDEGRPPTLEKWGVGTHHTQDWPGGLLVACSHGPGKDASLTAHRKVAPGTEESSESFRKQVYQ